LVLNLQPALVPFLLLVVASLAIPAFVALRYGGQAARISAGLWPVVSLGAIFLLAPLLDRLSSVSPVLAGGVALPLYALMLIHLGLLAIPRMRGAAHRALILIPGTVLSAACLLAVPFGLAASMAHLGCREGVCWLALLLEVTPLLLALVSIAPSIRPRQETAIIRPPASDGELWFQRRATRCACERLRYRGKEEDQGQGQYLRIAQITDPHLGGLWSIQRTIALIERLLAREPDLVLLTGDLLALEGMFTPGALAQALSPLRERRGLAFAALGNHDLDAPEEIRAALAANGISLLVDQTARVQTRMGAIEIIGVDHLRTSQRSARRKHLRAVLSKAARQTSPEVVYRICLLHDPSRFGDIDLSQPKSPNLFLSGHVHGGQIGLVSLGLPWTVLTGSRWPDHGLWGFGGALLYVHRGTGTFGFPLRIGVPGEESIVQVDLGLTS
jgi:predicted MPP superfamily phosphohydrolase